MHHCPNCKRKGVIEDAREDGVHEYGCPHCFHEWRTTEVPDETLRELLARSLRLAALEGTPAVA